MIYFWPSIAAILYLIPVFYGVSIWQESVEDAKDWMRESGNWYPALAAPMVALSIAFWPATMTLEAIKNGADQ